MTSIRQQFEKIVIENTDWLLRVIKSKLRNIELAEDILQEVFVKAFRAYDQYEEQGKILGVNAKSEMYIAIPHNAENVRVKRGNGMIDCGTYKFICAERYVTEQERIVVEGSFILREK